MFYTEIQDGNQKWWENLFKEKSLVDSVDSLRVKNFVKISHRLQDKWVFAFYVEIQDGHQKWQENDFWEKLPD